MTEPNLTRHRPKTRRTHRARRSRWAALGLSGVATASIVAALGASQDASSNAAEAAAPSEVVIVVHHSSSPTVDGTTANDPPVQLRADPVIRTVERAPATAPVARTNGSR